MSKVIFSKFQRIGNKYQLKELTNDKNNTIQTAKTKTNTPRKLNREVKLMFYLYNYGIEEDNIKPTTLCDSYNDN